MTGKLTRRGAALAWDYILGRNFQKSTAHTVYMALLTTVPTDTVTPITMVEVSSTGYARQAISWSAPAVSNNQTLAANSASATFGPFTDSGGMPLAAVAACMVQNSSGTSGDVITYWVLDTPVQAAQGESLLLPIANAKAFQS